MFTTSIAPDFRRLEQAARNQKTDIMPLYEHNVSCDVIGELTGKPLKEYMESGRLDEGFAIFCDFFRQTGYDAIPFEQCITMILPERGAILGGRPGPIQNAADLNAYPWGKLPDLFWDMAAPQFEALGRHLPAGMRAVGGVGNGVFEISEDLTGLEYLPFMMLDDENTYADLYHRIGDLMYGLWERFLREFGELYCVCRIGDDLGFRTSLLTMPETIREHIIPQYRRVIELAHQYGKPFLLHSCGCIFEVMDDLIAAGIDAKHSNEDGIAPFEQWIGHYSDHIALFGGIDVDLLVRSTPAEIRELTVAKAEQYYSSARGFALGTGNSVPEYVPAENYLAMLEGAEIFRSQQSKRGGN